MTEVVVTTGATRRAKVQSNQHPDSYRPDALSVAQPTVTQGKCSKRINKMKLNVVTHYLLLKLQRAHMQN